MAYEFFEPFPDIRPIRALFIKELIAFPKVGLDFKRSVINPSAFSFLNVLSTAGHFRADWDPYSYHSALDKYEKDDKTRIGEDEVKRQKYLADIKALEIQVRETTGQAKESLERRIVNMREHEIHKLSKPFKKPQMFDNRFLIFEADVDSKFSDEDSVKFKYGNNGFFEANFFLKNLVDKSVLTQDLSAFKRNVYDIMKTKELYVNLTKELGKSSLKTINLQLKSKTTPQHLSLTVSNNVNKVERIERVDGVDKPVTREKVTSNYKVVYNCPLNENLKIKATFLDNFLANNQLEFKLRKNIFGKLNFQNYYAMKFSFNTETVHSKERTPENKVNYQFQNALINVLKPEKAVFAFTYDIDSSLEHRFRPYVGLVVHNIANNKITSLNLGYLHNMDFTKRSPDGTIYGLRANYSLFYKYEDFITWLKKEKIISKGDNHPGAQNVSSPLAGKECLSLGSEFIYLFDKNDYLYSCTAKVLVTDTAIRIHKNLLFKKWGDYYNYLNVAFKFNIEKENNKYAYRSGINVEIL